jgi:hypothetical protein
MLYINTGLCVNVGCVFNSGKKLWPSADDVLLPFQLLTGFNSRLGMSEFFY